MKLLILFVGVVVLLIVVAQALGWKNFGNLPPVVANKIALIKGEPSPPLLRRSVVSPGAAFGLGKKSCRDFLAAVQGQQPVDSYLDWIEGFLNARSVDNPLPAHLVTRDHVRTAFMALCAENSDRTVAVAAMMLVERFLSQPLR